MKQTNLRHLCFLVAISAGTALAGTLSGAPVVFRSGDWSVLRTVDQMTDKTSCTGIYKSDYGIQLTDDELYIKVRGGIKGVVLRFGDQPAEKMRLATKSEQNISSIDVEGSAFEKLLGSSRLRAQVLTVLGNVVDFDVDLNGLPAAVENIRAQCPGAPLDTQSTQAGSACGDKVIARLREKGVSKETIEFACSLK
jgi:hypothetical protein